MKEVSSPSKKNTLVFNKDGLQCLIELLVEKGYCVMGPTIIDGAIVYDEISGLDSLPVGWTDHQDAGTYRLSQRDDGAVFGYVVGPHSWKRFLHPPRQRLWQAQRHADGIQVVEDNDPVPKFAFLGVRSCELHAIAIQDNVFLASAYQDKTYSLRRKNLLIIAVNCGQAGGTCFCASTKTGPEVTSEFDLALTEILDGKEHRFLVEIGSSLGADLIKEISTNNTAEEDLCAARDASELARSQMGRTMDTNGIKELLQNNAEHPRWDDVAERCLTCANCTMVCPTCFCTTVEDVTDLGGNNAERWQRWDSCFTMDFSHIHGGNVRSSAKSRYRQWMTHKLSHWFDQFGTSGCVGCGRCITWCPVGIDITEEVAAIQRGSDTKEDTP